MKISIIIPVYNEQETIEAVLNKIIDSDTLGWEKEIIVVDDASTDSTAQALEPLKNITFEHFRHEKNQGKGVAIKTGLAAATGDIILIQDADLEYDPKDYPVLLSPFALPETQVVFGYRTVAGYKTYYFGNKIFTGFVNMLFGSDLKDPYTGYKVIKKTLLESLNLKSRGFELEAEITSKLLKRKIKIIQVPISYQPRTFGKGKKARLLRDGAYGLWTFFKYRLSD